MKKLILLVTLSFSALSFAQNKGFVEKTSTDLGKVLGFKASLVSEKNLGSNAVENHLALESKGFAASDVTALHLDKAGVSELLETMKALKSRYFTTPATSSIEISSTSQQGYEIGGIFVLDKVAASAPTTKKEKYYIETKEKYYEGKIVNHDASGSYIWKEVSGVAAKEITGKWAPFLRLKNSSSYTTMDMSIEEFDAFVKFLEDNMAKL